MTEQMNLQYRAKYAIMQRTLTNLLNDLAILAGEKMGQSGVSWQDVAGTASTNALALGNMLAEARKGNHEAAIVFPSPSECMDDSE